MDDIHDDVATSPSSCDVSDGLSVADETSTVDDMIASTEDDKVGPVGEKVDTIVKAEMQMELDSGHRIITEIIRQNKTTCWHFLKPVDVEGLGLWDYYDKIKEPMCLNKILEKFENNEYFSFAEFARDFRVMVENCYRYNTTEHPISKKAKRLEMLFEGKLALLKRGIRDSASIAKTSNGRFATLADTENVNPTMRSGRVSIPANGIGRDADAEVQTRLVYDFVRCEETTLAEDEKQASYRERKHQQTLYQQIAAAYVNSLESREEAKHIRTCYLLPEIGLFLHLNEATLRLPPLAMYNLEMSLMVPSHSLYLAKIMTSFLCTYYERSLISQRPPMSFRIWENRLKQRVEKWYDTVCKYNSYQYAADKLFLGIEFFHDMKWTNPFVTNEGREKSFMDLTYNEKAHIIKALCDSMMTFQSIQNNIASLPCEQSRSMSLGFDLAGNEYTYFPQFCGDDIRIYKHRQYGELPHYDAPQPLTVIVQRKNKIKPNSFGQVLPPGGESISQQTTSSKSDETADVDVELPLEENEVEIKSESCIAESLKSQKKNTDRAMKDAQESVECSRVTCTEAATLSQDLSELNNVEKFDEDIKLEVVSDPSSPNNEISVSQNVSCLTSNNLKCDNSPATPGPLTNGESQVKNQANIESDISAHAATNGDETIKTEEIINSSDLEVDNEKPLVSPSSETVGPDISSEKDTICKSDSLHLQESVSLSPCSQTDTVTSTIDNSNLGLSNCEDKSESGQTTPKSTPKKRRKRGEIPAESPFVRRSLRKRAVVNYSSMLVQNEPVAAASETSSSEKITPKKRQRRSRTPRKNVVKIVKIEEPEEEYGSVDFELVCDSVDSLRQLIPLIEQEREEAVNEKKSAVVIDNVNTLSERLNWLLGELESFDTHFEKARFDAKIRLKRENDEIFQAATTGKAIQTNTPDVDPWEEEHISKSTMIQGENSTTYTPPSSVYVEESDEESDRELRRSKRKPKRYESDEDFVVDSEDESVPVHQATQFLYDEYDEGRQRLIPAALLELEDCLQKQAAILQKMMGCGRVTRQNDIEVAQLGMNERRTRQKSKKENKVFRKVLLMAMRYDVENRPSLLPLLRTDQSEIGEVVERVLAQEAVARQQRRLAREQEQKRKREIKEAMLQKTKAANAKQRAAKKLLAKYKNEHHESKEAKHHPTSMWSPPKKQPNHNIQPPVGNPSQIPPKEKAENVMIRLHNGKVCQALRFPDGRVAPIVRVDNSSKAASIEDLTSGLTKRNVKPQVEHPHISLTGNRGKTASILKRPTVTRKQNPTSSALAINSTTVGQKTNTASMLLANASRENRSISISFQRSTVTTATSPDHRINTAANKTVLTPAGVAQRLTLPSGEVINLVVKSQASNAAGQQGTVDRNSSSQQSLGKIFVKNATSKLHSSPVPRTVVLSRPVQSVPAEVKPALNTSSTVVVSSATVNSSSQINAFVNKSAGKPLGIVSPMQVRQASDTSNALEARQNAAKTLLSVARGTPRVEPAPQQANIASPVMAPPMHVARYQEVPAVIGGQDQQPIQLASSQQLQLGMRSVALVSPPVYQQQQVTQPVQLVQTLVPGSVPFVQPVQFVQAVPIQVQTPVVFVAPSQPQLQMSGMDSTRYVLSTSAATTPQAGTVTTQSSQQYVLSTFSPEKYS